DLLSGKVVIAPNIGHGSQYISQGPPLGSAKRRLEDFAMLLLSTAVVLCGAPLQCLNQLVRQLANNQPCHRSSPRSTLAGNDSARPIPVRAVLALEARPLLECL